MARMTVDVKVAKGWWVFPTLYIARRLHSTRLVNLCMRRGFWVKVGSRPWKRKPLAEVDLDWRG